MSAQSPTGHWPILDIVHEKLWPVLTGERCTLSVVSLEDAATWKAGEDEEQRRWFEFPAPAPMGNVVEAIRHWREQWAADGPVRQWGIWSNGQLAGGVELRDRGDRRANLSYVVFPPFRRRGLATEAISLATAWGFGNLPVDATVAIIDERNTASRSTAERSGFILDGPAEAWEYDESGPCLRYVLWAPNLQPGAP